ncbi:DUF3431 domain-containing protein [Microdochium nivale]|nr:DUF3431 domain-containing protein [Microdochium nivale]
MLLRRRGKLRLYAVYAVVAIVSVYVYITVPGSNGWMNSWQTMDSAQYVQDALHDKLFGPPRRPTKSDAAVTDKVIVMVHLPSEDVSWVARELPDWKRAIYPVPPNTVVTSIPAPADKPPAELRLPVNKGHEAMAYITYLIDFYHHLPAIVLFLHAHEDGYHRAWHVDARLHSNVVATRELRLDTVKQRGYVNMRCNPRSNCLHTPRPDNFHLTPNTEEVWRQFWANTSTPVPKINELMLQRKNIDDADPHGVPDLATHPFPPIADPSGGQFAVTREAILARPREDYIALREWLFATDLHDEESGRVFEFNWHILFGMPGVLCYERSQCECDTFGRCRK